MKKLFEEDDHEQDKMERARILMAVIPVVLILLILAFMLIKSRIGQGREDKEDLQQSIMDYADEKNEAQAGEQTLPADSSSVSTAAPGADPEGAGEGDNASPPTKENEEPAAAEDKNETGEGLQSQPGRTATPTPYKEVMETGKKDYSKITFHKEEQLGDMMAYWADNNQKALLIWIILVPCHTVLEELRIFTITGIRTATERQTVRGLPCMRTTSTTTETGRTGSEAVTAPGFTIIST